MNIGDLNKLIVIQSPTRIADNMGGFTETYRTEATVWAKKWTVSSVETTMDMKTTMIRVQKFAIRFRAPLLPSWRIKHGLKYYNISSIDPDDKDEFLYLTVKEAI